MSTRQIMLITDSFPPAEGGSRMYYYSIYKQFPKEEILIVTKKVKGWEKFDELQNIKIIRKGLPLKTWKYGDIAKTAPYILYCLWLIVKYRIDIVDCGDLFPAGVIGIMSKWLLGRKYIIYAHGEELTTTQKFRLQPKIYKIIFKNASLIIAACEFARKELIRMGIEESKIPKITPGVDLNRFKPMVVNKELLDKYEIGTKKVVLSICRLIERKGIDSVIKAMPKVLAQEPNVLYLIGGRGEYHDKLVKLVSDLHLDKNVKFIGFVSQEELPMRYNLCDIFIMCNKEIKKTNDIEGFGMVFLEANAVGKPVIGGNTGGTGDSIIDGTTGFRVNSEDPKEIADKLLELLTNSELCRAMGLNGRKRAEKFFKWEQRTQEVRNLHFSLLNKDQ